MAPAPPRLALAVAALASLLAPCACVGGSSPGRKCANTVSGRWLVADDRGAVCERAMLDYGSGCCRQAKPDACKGCQPGSCCEEFEYCVSCCMSRPEEAAQYMAGPRMPGHEETGKWASTFEYCRGRCRTNGGSTVHENAYKSAAHHCFGDPSSARADMSAGKGQGARQQAERAEQARAATMPAGAVVLAAEPGRSCDQACGLKGRRCSLQGVKAANRCEEMRKQFKCAECEDSYGPDQPAYSPQSKACLVNSPARNMFSCDGSHPATQRLCACV